MKENAEDSCLAVPMSKNLFNALLEGLTLLISAVAFFLTAWIIVPAPTLALLPLGVGAPEMSPWLIGANAIAALLAWRYVRRRWLHRFVLACCFLSLAISTLPLSQFPAANQRAEAQIQTALGTDYWAQIAPSVRAQMRPKPFVLVDAFRGIPEQPVRTTGGILFAKPDGVPLTLTVYRPPQVGKHPTIVVIYGGAWQRGSPDDDAPFNRYMAARGYTVVVIDYRHAPRYRFPAQLEDVRSALTYIQQHAETLEVDSTRLALMGRSAGAHLAMLAAYQPGSIPMRAIVNYYGPIDLTKGYYDLPNPDPIDSRAVLNAFLGGSPEQFPTLYRQASPFALVNQHLPPSLLVYGGHDHLVQAKFGRSLYDRLQATGNRAVWLEIPWAEHAFDAVFNGVSNQLALYYTERFLAWSLR